MGRVRVWEGEWVWGEWESEWGREGRVRVGGGGEREGVGGTVGRVSGGERGE